MSSQGKFPDSRSSKKKETHVDGWVEWNDAVSESLLHLIFGLGRAKGCLDITSLECSKEVHLLDCDFARILQLDLSPGGIATVTGNRIRGCGTDKTYNSGEFI
jgi:hypothetical protein